MTTTTLPIDRRPARGRRALAAETAGASPGELRAALHRGDSVAHDALVRRSTPGAVTLVTGTALRGAA